MPTWGQCFKTAIKAAIFGVIWIIIGGVIAIAGAGIALAGLYAADQTAAMAALVGGGIVALIGAIIGAFGYSASIIKFTVELAQEEILGRR